MCPWIDSSRSTSTGYRSVTGAVTVRVAVDLVKWIKPEWSRASDGKRHIWTCSGHRYPLLFPTFDLQEHKLWLVCEGEWDALTAISLKFAAVTSTGGSGKWDSAWNPLFHSKDVVIVRDLDAAGLKHARLVFDNLEPVANSVRVLRWSDLL